MMESILVFKWVSQFSLTFGLLQDHRPDDFVRCIYCSFMQGAQIGGLSDGCKLLKSSRIPNISQSFQWLRHKILPSHKFAFTFKPFVVGKPSLTKSVSKSHNDPSAWEDPVNAIAFSNGSLPFCPKANRCSVATFFR